MILLIGGTSETAPLAEGLAGAGYEVLVSTATRTPLAIGAHPRISRRAGRLDEEGLVALGREKGIRAVVDAAHPYAVAAHAAACRAAGRLGIPCLAFRRAAALLPHSGAPPGPLAANMATPAPAAKAAAGPAGAVPPPQKEEVAVPEEPVLFSAGHEEAARMAFSDGRPVLLTTGSRNLAPYAGAARRSGVPLAVRVLDAPEALAACREAAIPEGRIITGRGPFSLAENLAAIRRFSIGVIVTKESGQAGGFGAKLAAARKAGCRLVVIRRPEAPPGVPGFDRIAALIDALTHLVPPARRPEAP